MGRMIVVNPDGDPDKDRNMVQNLLGLYVFFVFRVLAHWSVKTTGC